jgi:transglutaminase-like putative cysteine protease
VKLKITLTIIAVFVLGAFFVPLQVFAQEDEELDESLAFTTSYDTIYSVDSKGSTHTRQIITMKNNFEKLYASEYSIIIGSNQLDNITATDNFGALSPEVEVGENETTLTLPFTQRLVGKDLSRRVTLEYTTPDFAFVKGMVLETGFPLFTRTDYIDEYVVKLRVPTSFGDPTEIVPEYTSKSTHPTYNEYVFDKKSLLDFRGVQATFGSEQILDFRLRYTIENLEKVKGRTEIVFPSDTNYQQVIFSSVDPVPENVRVDEDGNWLAEYIIEPESSQEIYLQGSAKLFLEPIPEFARELTAEELEQYTKSDEYWGVHVESARELAQELGSPEAIYDYIVENFVYDYGRLNGEIFRYGSEYALENPTNAICMEFTDTFVTLVRALGIPAREHNGYAYTENSKLRPLSLSQDVLHAWPEYYDFASMQWVMVDPTWANTTGGVDYFHKFDLDHFSFVRHGVDNSYPVVPGSYKTDDTVGKDIEVVFGDTFEAEEDVNVFVSQFPSGIKGLNSSGYILVENTGNTALYDLNVPIDLVLEDEVIGGEEVVIEVLPPLGSELLPVVVRTDFESEGGNYRIETEVLGVKKSSEFELRRLLPYPILVWGSGALLAGLLWGGSYKLVNRWLSKRKKVQGSEEEEVESHDKSRDSLIHKL